MEFIAPSNRLLHRPFRIGDGPSETGPRLGGRAPELATSPKLVPEATYVLTLPLTQDGLTFTSVFLNAGSDGLWDAMNQGLLSDARIVVVRHGPTKRRASDEHRSVVSEHPLVVNVDLEQDVLDDEEGGQVFSSAHKFGGRPHCIQEPELEGAEMLLDRGYRQVLQLDFPDHRDAEVSGNWPFADGLFNLFMHPDASQPSFWSFQE